MSADPSTPLMRQYHGIKQQVPNTLLMFLLGDFYELFYDDAVTAARELEITLTARNKERASRSRCVECPITPRKTSPAPPLSATWNLSRPPAGMRATSSEVADLEVVS